MTSVSAADKFLSVSAQINLVEIIKKHFGGRRAAVHDHEIGFVQRANHGVQSARMGQIQKFHVVAVKAFQRGIFVVAVAGDVNWIFLSLRYWTKLTAKKLLPTPPLPLKIKSRRLVILFLRVAVVQLWRCEARAT